MNRIFFALVLIAVLSTGYRQLTWVPPPPTPLVEAPASGSPLGALEARLDALEAKPPRSPFRIGVHATRSAPDPTLPPIKQLTKATLDSAKLSVDLALSLVGAMALFLGLMKVGEEGGLLEVIAKLIRPLMVRLFPDVPPDHPAMGAMILNMSANALGLGNAATPFGIRAMVELNKLNTTKGTATNAMCLFLAINTSSVTLLPTGVIVIRDALGSHDAEGILATTLFATLCSTIAAIIGTKFYQRFSSVPVPDPVDSDDVSSDPGDGDDDAVKDHGAYPGWVTAIALASVVACIPLAIVYGAVVSPWIIPALMIGLLGYGFAKGVPVYEAFVRGAKQGFEIAILIIPYLVAILVAVGMFRASGALDVMVAVLGPVTRLIGMPPEALPMALIRPLSGSGANGVMASIMEQQGPDSFVGYLVSTMQGSTETTFYVLAVYFGAAQVQRTRHAVAGALTADLFGVLGAVAAVHLYFAWNGL